MSGWVDEGQAPACLIVEGHTAFHPCAGLVILQFQSQGWHAHRCFFCGGVLLNADFHPFGSCARLVGGVVEGLHRGRVRIGTTLGWVGQVRLSLSMLWSGSGFVRGRCCGSLQREIRLDLWWPGVVNAPLLEETHCRWCEVSLRATEGAQGNAGVLPRGLPRMHVLYIYHLIDRHISPILSTLPVPCTLPKLRTLCRLYHTPGKIWIEALGLCSTHSCPGGSCSCPRALSVSVHMGHVNTH